MKETIRLHHAKFLTEDIVNQARNFQRDGDSVILILGDTNAIDLTIDIKDGYKLVSTMEALDGSDK